MDWAHRLASIHFLLATGMAAQEMAARAALAGNCLTLSCTSIKLIYALLAAGLAAQDVAVRTVEPGSRLVAVPSGGTVAVLQLPRGNLEVVSPRILVLKAIAAELQVNWVQGCCCCQHVGRRGSSFCCLVAFSLSDTSVVLC